MQWIRNVSLVKRVTCGFFAMGAIVAGVGACGIWALHSQAGEFDRMVQASAGTAIAPEAAQAMNAAASATEWWLGCAAVAGFLAAAAGGWLIRASIKESIESTIDSVVRIAGGDLETKIESPGKDEISWLRAELNGMRKKLRKTMIDVRETVEGVNTASAEIASGNTDLSVRTESQSSALQETTSSMQQLAETVRSNAESTQEAKAVVTQSNQVAARGAEMMQDVIARMGEINASSVKISDIIGVIDGIAFQTNILALNAAVEAARAGDHGRGFAVVASEVRTLAQRSSGAAREIKQLIGDSSEKVEAGSKLVNEAGRTMHDIVASVDRVSSLISDIAMAGEAQNGGIAQVHNAISQIDTMTQQNAALVEELAAAAQSLQAQSGKLNESMGSFRVAA